MKRYNLSVYQNIEEAYEVEAESFEEACDKAEDLFRDEFGIDAWMGDYGHILHYEEDLEDEYEDETEADDNRQRAADMNATLRGGW